MYECFAIVVISLKYAMIYIFSFGILSAENGTDLNT